MKGPRAARLLPLLFALFILPSWATQVRILNWNIHRDIGTQAPDTAGQPYLAKIVNYLNPDIWIMQEIGGNNSGYNATNEKNALKTFVSSYLTIYGANPVEGVNYHVYVCVNTDGWISNALVSRWPLASATDVSMGSPGRGIVIAKVNVPGTNGLGVFTAHFKSAGGASGAENRQTNAENTRNQVNTWAAANSACAYVLGGDFNESEDAGDNDVYPIGTVLSNGHVYHPITTVKETGMGDVIPLDGLSGKRSWNTTSPTIRFDYLFTSANNGVRDSVTVLSKQLVNTNRWPGSLPPGFVSSDSTNASDHSACFATVDVTAPTVTVNGNVYLDGYLGGAGIGSTLQFRTPGTQNVVYSKAITLDVNGDYSATGVPKGTYDVALKFPNWLRSVIGNVIINSNTALNFALPNGDVDDNNTVNLFDMNEIFNEFSGTGPADIDWNGTVDLFDLNLLFGSFGQNGSP